MVGNRELSSWNDGRCPRAAMTLLALLALSSEQPPSVRSTAASIRSLPPSLAAAICFTCALITLLVALARACAGALRVIRSMTDT